MKQAVPSKIQNAQLSSCDLTESNNVYRKPMGHHISLKGQTSNISVFAVHKISVVTTEFCNYHKSSHRKYINRHSCVPIKLYLQRQILG